MISTGYGVAVPELTLLILLVLFMDVVVELSIFDGKSFNCDCSSSGGSSSSRW